MNVKQQEVAAYIEAVRTENIGKSHSAFVLTFGCQQNEADSEKMRGLARDMGYTMADTAEDASFIIINTCAIRKHAEDKALSLLGTYKALKKKNPDLIVGVCGCMAAEKTVVSWIKHKFPFVSFTLEPNLLYRLPELVYGALCEHKNTYVYGMDTGDMTEGIEPVRRQKHRAWVSIMYGCNNFCSYCIVPYVRGRERSRDSAAVLSECAALVADGCREITLLGQNVNSYRSDVDFSELVRRIAALPGDFIIRFMTSHPKDVSDGLIRAMHDFPNRIAPSFHLPLQSGNDRVLKAMNRTYTRESYLEIVRKLRAAVPDITLTTDVIVGFPGETEEEFEDTLDVVRNVGYDSIYSFIYSPRTGTKAAAMENQIPADVSVARLTKLISLSQEIAYQKNLPLEGKDLRVLADEPADEGGYLGRTLGGKLVRFSADTDPTGNFITVHIDKATPFDLLGKMI